MTSDKDATIFLLPGGITWTSSKDGIMRRKIQSRCISGQSPVLPEGITGWAEEKILKKEIYFGDYAGNILVEDLYVCCVTDASLYFCPVFHHLLLLLLAQDNAVVEPATKRLEQARFWPQKRIAETVESDVRDIDMERCTRIVFRLQMGNGKWCWVHLGEMANELQVCCAWREFGHENWPWYVRLTWRLAATREVLPDEPTLIVCTRIFAGSLKFGAPAVDAPAQSVDLI